MSTNFTEHFIQALKNLEDNEDFVIVLSYLKDSVLNKSPIGDNEYITYYHIGQQDIVRDIIQSMDLDMKELDRHIYSHSDTVKVV